MKLYIYEHCPFCTRARMIFGLKKLPVELAVIMEGDTDTPTRLVGRKVVPILQKEDGSHMAESLDIVQYVENLGAPVLTAKPDAALDAWGQAAWQPALGLIIPRFTQGDFAELATPEAREAYRLREQKAFGDLDALLQRTPELLAQINPLMAQLATLLNGRSEETGPSDILLWPLLRCLSIVGGLDFPAPVLAYARRLERQSGVPLLFDQQIH